MVRNNQVWLIAVNRISVIDSGIWIVTMYDSKMYVYEISKSASMTIETNELGTVYVKYNSGVNNYVYGGAIRLC